MTNIANLLIEHFDIWTAADNEKKSGRGRTSGNAGSVYGVKKLRELILELAVRGKLVPQDANDEPASELLKRIQTEKAKLIAEGKLKKEKSLSPIGDDEKPFELPKGWDYASFGDVVEIIRGITFPGSEKSKSPENGRIACLRTTNVQDQIEWEDILYIKEQFVSREDQLLKPNDIVMSMANSRELVGKVALVGNQIKEKTTFGGFLGVIRPYSILPKFVLTLLRTPLTREALIDNASQTTNIANISLAKLKPLFFAIPPLAEQHRIVAKADELMALCDQLEQQHSNAQEAHETLVSQLLATLTQSQNAAEFNANWQRIFANFDVLFTTEASIDALKQTLLQLAVMGKLVPQDANDEPASELLKRIQAEKAKLIAEGKLKIGKPPAPIAEDEKPFELPKYWKWVQWIELTAINDAAFKRGPFGSSLRKDMFVSSGYKVYEQYCPINDDCSFERYFVTKEKFDSMKDFAVKANDFLISCSGVTLGRITQVPEVFNEGIINQALLRVRMNREYIDSDFFKLLFRSPYFQKMIFENSTGSAIPNVKGVQDLKKMAVPFLPIAEQKRIVAKVDALMALCDQLKFRIQQANQKQQAISDALVAQALEPTTAEIIDLASYRAAVACHIIKQNQSKPYFGRTAAMKLLYLAQAHIGLELNLQPEREAAGPLDKWIYDFERQGKQSQWFSVNEKQISNGKTKVEYEIKSGIAEPIKLIEQISLDQQRKELDRMFKLFADKNTEEAEIIATLFAAWNDYLIDGSTPTDDQVVKEVRENWHESKARFTPTELNKWLAWLRSNNLVPQGHGPRTKYQQSLIND